MKLEATGRGYLEFPGHTCQKWMGPCWLPEVAVVPEGQGHCKYKGSYICDVSQLGLTLEIGVFWSLRTWTRSLLLYLLVVWL